MKSENVIVQKSFAFALRVIKVGKYLVREKSEYVLSKQLLRSGTSIGANVEEAVGGQSRADFYAKMTIAYKEARESAYWIRLLGAAGYLTQKEASILLHDVEELMRILGTIQLATRRKIPYTKTSIRNS